MLELDVSGVAVVEVFVVFGAVIALVGFGVCNVVVTVAEVFLESFTDFNVGVNAVGGECEFGEDQCLLEGVASPDVVLGGGAFRVRDTGENHVDKRVCLDDLLAEFVGFDVAFFD